MATTQIPLPEKLESKKPEEWRRWIERFECYHIAAGLDEKDGKVQINTLVYAMGGNANDLLKSFQIQEDDMNYKNVVEQFASHFVGRSNIIFERARFNKRVQGKKESVLDFVEDLYKLADSCQFGSLKDELIRDRIVVGIRNANLSQRLMQDEKLTLDKAVREVKSSEFVKHHHEILQGDGEDGKLDRVKAKKRYGAILGEKPKLKINHCKNSDQSTGKKCFRCGRSPVHKREAYPAYKKTCLKCNKQGHFAVACRSNSSKQVQSVHEEYFLGAVKDKEEQAEWTTSLTLGKSTVKFKIDTGADVTVIPESDKVLFRPNQAKLSIKGKIRATLKTATEGNQDEGGNFNEGAGTSVSGSDSMPNNVIRTRSGRIVKAPTRLFLYTLFLWYIPRRYLGH